MCSLWTCRISSYDELYWLPQSQVLLFFEWPDMAWLDRLHNPTPPFPHKLQRHSYMVSLINFCYTELIYCFLTSVWFMLICYYFLCTTLLWSSLAFAFEKDFRQISHCKSKCCSRRCLCILSMFLNLKLCSTQHETMYEGIFHIILFFLHQNGVLFPFFTNRPYILLLFRKFHEFCLNFPPIAFENCLIFLLFLLTSFVKYVRVVVFPWLRSDTDCLG